MAVLRSLYRLFLPKAVRLKLHRYVDAYRKARKARRLQRYKKQLGSPARRQRQLAELRTVMQERPLRVAFQVSQLSKWKCDRVLQLMMADPQFEPAVWVVHFFKNAEQNRQLIEREAQPIRRHFEAMGTKVVDYAELNDFPAAECPDLVFIPEPYDVMFRRKAYKGLTEVPVAYIPYCFHNTFLAESHNGIGNNTALFCFYENEYMCRLTAGLKPNGGCNNVNSGNPIADIFLAPEALTEPVWKDCGRPLKKVIWAPHWTIRPGLSWVLCGTFLKNAEAMVELAKKYQDRIQFAFKPHPHLYRALCSQPGWGQEKTDAFYRLWAEMPNTQLAEGEYTALIMQSDAMVHDSGSFILEYLFADKPAMFLREGDGYANYNEMSIEALQSYRIGLTGEDIEDFLQQSVLGSADPLAAVRAEMRRKYLLPPNGRKAAQNILETIKNC